MCGIAGVYNKEETVSIDRLDRMVRLLSHRGPNAVQLWKNEKGNIAFGHTRLSIIDLTTCANQPMKSRDGRFTITYNGEIYNYLELKQYLRGLGYDFKTNSDTEVLLALYELKKEKCLDLLDGMFAFAIWDSQENQLFCVRDRFGEKPFFYAKTGDNFVFASEMKSLWNYGVPRKISNKMLYNYLTSNLLFNPDDFKSTFFENIYRLEPAHYMIVDHNNNIKTTKYWHLDYKKCDPKISEEEAAEQIRSLLVTSVERRLRSDVKVGATFSGGIDSTAIVSIINKILHYNKKFNTFSARFIASKTDEGKYIKEVVNNNKIIYPYFTFPTLKQFVSEFDDLLYHQEEPIGSPSVYAQYKVMRLAKQNNIKVLLDGQGADEVFGGYSYFIKPFLQELYREDRSEFRRQLKHLERQKLPYLKDWKFYVQAKYPHMVYKAGFVKKWILEKKFKPYISPTFYNEYDEFSVNHKIRSFSSLNRSLYDSAVNGALQELLRYSDRNSMANSVEVRLPFLNHELVEYAFSLPATYKISNGNLKYILRKSMQDIMPDMILNRKDKVAFETPKEWMKSPVMKEMAIDAFHFLAKEDILNPKAINLFIQHYDSTNLSWNALIISKILQQKIL